MFPLIPRFTESLGKMSKPLKLIQNCLGVAGAKRRRIGSGIRGVAPPSQKEITFSYRGAPASESSSISVHCSTRSHMGQLRVAARPRTRTIFRELRHQYGGRTDARSSQ